MSNEPKTYRMSIVDSTTIMDRFWFYVKFDVNAGRIDFTRIANGIMPTLLGHNPNLQTGRVTGYEIEDGTLFLDYVWDDEDSFAQRIREKVDSGILRGTSIGAGLRVPFDDDDIAIIDDDYDGYGSPLVEYRGWEPVEASHTPIPANPNVGTVAMSMTPTDTSPIVMSADDWKRFDKIVMSKFDIDPSGSGRQRMKPANIESTATVERGTSDMERIAEIAAEHDAYDMVGAAIKDGLTPDAFKQRVFELSDKARVDAAVEQATAPLREQLEAIRSQTLRHQDIFDYGAEIEARKADGKPGFSAHGALRLARFGTPDQSNRAEAYWNDQELERYSLMNVGVFDAVHKVQPEIDLAYHQAPTVIPFEVMYPAAHALSGRHAIFYHGAEGDDFDLPAAVERAVQMQRQSIGLEFTVGRAQTAAQRRDEVSVPTDQFLAYQSVLPRFTQVNGLIDDLKIPHLDAPTTTWQLDTTDITETDKTPTSVTLTPKIVTAGMAWTFLANLQSRGEVERSTIINLRKGMMKALETAAQSGSGISNQPGGLTHLLTLNSTNIAATVTVSELTKITEAAFSGGQLRPSYVDDQMDTWGNAWIVNPKMDAAIGDLARGGAGGPMVVENGIVRAGTDQAPLIYGQYLADGTKTLAMYGAPRSIVKASWGPGLMVFVGRDPDNMANTKIHLVDVVDFNSNYKSLWQYRKSA